MVQAAENGPRDDLALELDMARHRRVPVQRLMRPRGVVVRGVHADRAKEMTTSERNDVVGALPADRSDHSLDEATLS